MRTPYVCELTSHSGTLGIHNPTHTTKEHLTMPAYPNVDAAVTYFRTTLDPHDLYRIDDIINHAAPDDTSTPAAALATHLRGLSPALRWNTDNGQSVFEQAKSEVVGGLGLVFGVDDTDVGSYFLLDAAVFDSGDGSPVLVVNLRYDHQLQLFKFGRSLHVQSPRSGPWCAAYATTFDVAPHNSTNRHPFRRTEVSIRGEGAAHLVATRDEPVHSVDLRMAEIRPSVNTQEIAPAVPEGFNAVAWDSDTWKVTKRPHMGQDFFTDSLPVSGSEDDYPAICSAVMQGRGYVPVVNLKMY